jgi:o-succinylbenzoate synthase
VSSLLPSGQLDRIELFRVCVPLVEPFESAHGIERERWSILVRSVGSDGLEGWGECPALVAPTYTSEWHEGAWSVLANHLAPAALADRPSGVRGHPMAASALECALVDLELRRRGVSLAEAMGASLAEVPVCAVIGIRPGIDELLNSVGSRVAAGHRAVKLKIRPGWDLEPLTAVRQSWPDLGLAADANGSYAAGISAHHLGQLDALGLAYLEQPLDADDLIGLAQLARECDTPVALDESASSLAVVRTALALGPVGAVNLKPARLGGLIASADLHAALVDAGVPMWCGGMLELGVGRAAALAVAALPGCTLPTDLGPSANYVAEDVVEPFVLSAQGTLAVPDAPGIGRTPDLDHIESVVEARRTIR